MRHVVVKLNVVALVKKGNLTVVQLGIIIFLKGTALWFNIQMINFNMIYCLEVTWKYGIDGFTGCFS